MTRPLFTAVAVLLIAGWASGCGPAPSPSRDPAATTEEAAPPAVPTKVEPAAPAPGEAPPPAPSGSGADGSATPGEVQRDCLLVVDGVTHVDGRCWVYPLGDGGYTLNTWSHGKPARSHFAVVAINGSEGADASWNQDPDDSHAWDRLGTVTLTDGCWTNARVRVCAK